MTFYGSFDGSEADVAVEHWVTMEFRLLSSALQHRT